jgi:metal-sulfur cluster biosynthetic enzyme
MTLTAPGCGMGQFLADDVKSKVAAIPDVSEVNVQLTFEPPWDQSMMSEIARLETGLY